MDLQDETLIIGIDPGSSGAIGFLDLNGKTSWTVRLSQFTDAEIVRELRCEPIARAYLEKVHSTPQMGVSSAFTFGMARGRIEGILAGLSIPYDYVSPQAWRKALGLPNVGGGLQKGSAERKKQSKAKSCALFPHIKFVKEDADCLLIAEYGRRQFIGFNPQAGERVTFTEPAQLTALKSAVGSQAGGEG